MKKQNVRTLSFIICTFTYLLIGAAIFDALESQKEESVRMELKKTEIYFKQEYNISEEDYSRLEDIVIKYHPYRTFPQWKFTGAFYFSLTVITTIGYGHSTPQTTTGKTFCMLYALIGIPLCLIMFQSVGERFNYFASCLIEFVKKCAHIKKSEVSQTEMVVFTFTFTLIVALGGAQIFSIYEGWTWFDSVYYCVVTLTTIGFGDFVNQTNLSNLGYVIFAFTFILFGLTVVASSINLLVLKFLTMNTEDERREEFTRKIQEERRSLEMCQSSLLNVGSNGYVLCSFNSNNLKEIQKENTPLSFYQTLRKSTRSFFQKQFPQFFSQNSFCDTPTAKNEANQEVNGCISLKAGDKKIDTGSQWQEKNEKIPCPDCVAHLKRSKKTHYTIRRAPGKISHLIPTSTSSDLIINFDSNRKKDSSLIPV